MTPPTAIILAAGLGKRMKSDLPKVFHQVAGLPLVCYPIQLCQKLSIKKRILVTGKESRPHRKGIESLIAGKIGWVEQHPPLGTGHAVATALRKVRSGNETFLILYGDMPLVSPETIRRLIGAKESAQADLALVTALPDPTPEYGRIIRNPDESIRDIVEFRDATPDQRKIREVNVGIYLVSEKFLRSVISRLKTDNKQKEYYLTDLVKMARTEGKKIVSVNPADESESFGVNTQEERAEIERLIMAAKKKELMREGVSFVHPESVVIESQVCIGRGTRIMGPVFLMGETSIGKNGMIEPGSFIRDSRIGNGVHLKGYCYIEESRIDDGAQIGPFAHLRPLAIIGEKAKVGNFVEIKKSRIGKGSKVPHLSYIGDCSMGREVNIGAGTITCNYDGKVKHKTVIGDKVFVGSDTQFVAPIRVGRSSVIGAGSTITKNIKPFSLALTRADQKEFKNWVKKR